MATALELLENVVSSRGVLLRVGTQTPPGGRSASALLLTFDAGRLLLSVDPGSEELACMALEKPEDVPGGIVDVSEEDPWWRVLGAPLSDATVDPPDGTTLRLQFRPDDHNPRFITLSAHGASLRAALVTS